MNELDKIDIQLLKALQENARTSIKELASQVYLSSPATASRISRMEKMGYIKGYTVIEGESELGHPIKAIINIQTDRKGRESLFSFIYRCPNVTECAFVSGIYSIVISVFFENTQKLDKFINEIQKRGADTMTQIVLSTPILHRGIGGIMED